MPESEYKRKLIRITTSDISLDGLLEGQLKYLNQYFEVIALSNDTGSLERVAQREGVRTISVNMHREISLWNDLCALFSLYRIFRRERPDIVHANTPKGSLLAMVAAWLARVPHRIYTVTGLRFETATGAFKWLLKSMERITCLCATRVIPEGEGVKQTLLRAHITKKPLQKIHNGNINGIDISYFNPDLPTLQQTAASLRKPEFTFVFVGRLVKDKGITELVTAFDRLSKADPNVRLLLVGRFEDLLDPLPNQTKAMIMHHPQIEYMGYQKDVRPYILGSDILVLPSHREGFPNVLLQAGALGKPCIVTDVNGADEVITHEVNGLLVPKQDAEVLYQSMKRLLQDRSLYDRMVAEARSRIVTRFRREELWDAIRLLYKQLLLN